MWPRTELISMRGESGFLSTGDAGVEFAAFLVAEEWAAAFGAEHEMHDEVGEGLGHVGHALAGLG